MTSAALVIDEANRALQVTGINIWQASKVLQTIETKLVDHGAKLPKGSQLGSVGRFGRFGGKFQCFCTYLVRVESW